MNKIAQRDDLDAIQKFNLVMEKSKSFKMANRKVYRAISRWLFKEENIKLRHKIMWGNIDPFIEILAKIIEQGNNEGAFHSPPAREVAEVIMHIAIGMGESLGPMITKDSLSDEEREIITSKLNTYNQVVDLILGVEPGLIHMVKVEAFEELFNNSID
jgi:hypothetical protein